LQVQERYDPPPPAQPEVTVAIAAAELAFSEVIARIGVYPRGPKPPCVLGIDIAGTVLEVGSDVRTLQPGDRVFGVTRYAVTRSVQTPMRSTSDVSP
jgi:NADPH:quinone reductase-like Zn-dependent oxidoreductase